MKIYKYPFEVAGHISIDMPSGAIILTVQMQFNTPCLWALVDENVIVDERRNFSIFGTGHSIREINLTYLGTFQMMGGDLIWHLFERGKL